MADLMAQFQGMRDQMSNPVPMGAQTPSNSGQDDSGAMSQDQPSQPTTGLVEVAPRMRLDATIVPMYEQVAAAHPDLRLVSAARDAATNEREQGVKNSWHLKGRAFDLKGPIKSLHEAEVTADQLGATETLVHRGPQGMILHIGFGEEPV